MNENINLTKILKNCPKGIEFWSKLHGKITFEEIKGGDYPILIIDSKGCRRAFTKDGKFDSNYRDGECLIVPSREQQDWSKFTAPWYNKPKFNPKTLQPFDKVLVKNNYNPYSIWYADFVSYRRDIDKIPVTMYDCMTPMVIPYNEETKYLCGTSNEAPEYYRYWEDNEESTPKMSIK